MKHRDLGRLDGPVLLFGGPYSNLQALEALCDVADALGLSGRDMICTGDVVAYCGNPVETVALVRRIGCAVVAGNCEIQLAAGAEACGCGFEAGSACDLLSAGWFGFASAQIGAEDRSWMGALPDIITFEHQGARYGVLHGGASDVARFVWSSSSPELFAAEWAAAVAAVGSLDHIVAGHSGIPFTRVLEQGTWINAGAIGMPPHDGAAQTRYALLEDGAVSFRRLDYDVAGAIRAMEDARLSPDYARSLRSGYWPSEDVLPEDLRLPLAASG